MDYASILREKYREEDPWHYATCLYERVRHAAMAEFALAAEAQRVLDLGCGEGHFLGYLLDRAPYLEAVGVELEPAAAARARTRLAHRRVTLYTQDLADFLAEAAGQFDVAVCGDSLYYLAPDYVAARVVPGVARLLRPGGRLVVSYADVNDHGWTVEVFRPRFNLLRRIDLRPFQQPPPYPWVVALLEVVGGA